MALVPEPPKPLGFVKGCAVLFTLLLPEPKEDAGAGLGVGVVAALGFAVEEGVAAMLVLPRPDGALLLLALLMTRKTVD